MTGFYGADTEQLRAQGHRCQGGAARLDALVDELGSVIGTVEWQGPDADAFRALWQASVALRLSSGAADLRARGQRLEQDAEEQDSASDGGGSLLDLLFPMLGPFLPLPTPVPGRPLSPSVLDALQEALGDWFTGEGADGAEPYFYGDEGYGPGGFASDDRPVGQYDAGGSHWDGRELDNEAGYVDGYANTRASAGAHTTTDAYGNVTGTAGARAGAEIGFDEMLNLPGGAGLQADGRVGAEAYGEVGGTIGPDGFSVGAAAGAGVYGDLSASVMGPDGSSAGIGLEGYAGAEAHANAYSHATRNDEGQVNGWTVGADAGAFAGAKGDLVVEGTSPGGWFTGSAGFGASAGAGAGGGAGATISTDSLGFRVGGDVAAGLGINADIAVGVNPNAIVDTFTPGDYDLDDAISGASGAFEGAQNAVGDAFSSVNPFD